MEKDFWLERWQRNEIGFHQDEINPHLRKFWPELYLASGSTVLVPLCGKSRDMLWLRQQSHRVLGVELSTVAVQEFFREHGYHPQQINSDKFERYQADEISILRGDFFDLVKDDVAKVSAVYDRASLIALPPEMRTRYVRHLVSILQPRTQILLVALNYPQQEMDGPPFAVSSAEVEALYRGHAGVRLLSQQDVLAQNPRFRERGLTVLQESVFLLTMR